MPGEEQKAALAEREKTSRDCVPDEKTATRIGWRSRLGGTRKMAE